MIGTPCNRLFLEANSVMVLASWEVLIFQIVPLHVSYRALFNIGVLSRILFSSDLGSIYDTICLQKSQSKNSMRVAIDLKEKRATITLFLTFTIQAKSA